MATPPMVAKISRKPASDRIMACRNPIAPPSSRTIRAPTASRPRDLPWLSTSTVAGATTRQPTTATVATMPRTAASDFAWMAMVAKITIVSTYAPP